MKTLLLNAPKISTQQICRNTARRKTGGLGNEAKNK
jgi:hypothetical protein